MHGRGSSRTGLGTTDLAEYVFVLEMAPLVIQYMTMCSIFSSK